MQEKEVFCFPNLAAITIIRTIAAVSFDFVSVFAAPGTHQDLVRKMLEGGPPHLHHGIYKFIGGACNPYPLLKP
jgi:hypothetical protein